MNTDRRIMRSRAASAVSYALLLGLVALFGISMFRNTGDAVTSVFDQVNRSLAEADPDLFTGPEDDAAADAAGDADPDDDQGGDPMADEPEDPLFPFSRFTFTACRRSGPVPPTETQCIESPEYAGSDADWIDSETYGVSDGIQSFVVPVDGRYRITAVGARGSNNISDGGQGALVGGRFDLQQGDTLQILVGQAGPVSGLCRSVGQCSTTTDHVSGGGGASVVVLGSGFDAGTVLMVAAGGNGITGRTSYQGGMSALATQAPGADGGSGGAYCGGGYMAAGSGAGTSDVSAAAGLAAQGQPLMSGGVAGASPFVGNEPHGAGGFGGGAGSSVDTWGGGGGYQGGCGPSEDLSVAETPAFSFLSPSAADPERVDGDAHAAYPGSNQGGGAVTVELLDG